MAVSATDFATLFAEQQRRAIEDNLYWQMAEGELVSVSSPATQGEVELFPEYGDGIRLAGRLMTGSPFNTETMVYWTPQVRQPARDSDGNVVESLPAREGERCLVFWPSRQSIPYICIGVRDGVHTTGEQVVAHHLAQYGLVNADGTFIGEPLAYAISSIRPSRRSKSTCAYSGS